MLDITEPSHFYKQFRNLRRVFSMLHDIPTTADFLDDYIIGIYCHTTLKMNSKNSIGIVLWQNE